MLSPTLENCLKSFEAIAFKIREHKAVFPLWYKILENEHYESSLVVQKINREETEPLT